MFCRLFTRSLITLLALVAGLTVSRAASAATAMEKRPDPQQLAFFERKIRPVLVSKCYSCHSPQAKEIKGELQLDTKENTRKGGKSGPAVVPGNLDDSLIIEAIRWENEDRKMPPKQKLPDEVIADIEKWIEMGAPDPREKAVKALVKKVDTENGKNFWAFKPVRTTAAKSADGSWATSDIDRYILDGLDAKGLKPAPDASRAIIIRRVYFDLIGLPPSPEAVEAFVTSTDPKALENVVDGLLASPRFGERWGRYWLDIARYAESTGKDRNYLYPQAWRYRDYVIKSFNDDKPYDQFIKEQIAGDLLPSRNVQEHNEHLIATGFLALGTKSLNEKKEAVFRNDVIDDQVDVTTKAVMALTVACARCHDHKFDPIAMKDYYAVAGIFRSTRTFYGTGDSGGAVKNRQPSSLIPLNVTSSTQLASLKAELPSLNPKKKKKPTKSPGNSAGPAQLSGEMAMGVLDGTPVNSPIFETGEAEKPGALVPRGFVSVINSPNLPQKPSATQSGRLELATWLSSRSNPLTARVMVNRIWQHLFGEGLVRSTDNFGATGDRPSHPELLDYLAARFVASKWSVKQVVRSIVLTRAYQMSNQFNAQAAEVDPENALLWRFSERRLDAEAIRDSMLTVSGNLELTPPQTSFVSVARDGQVGKNGMRPEKFTDFEANYRSVYLPIVRDAVPSMLSLFDFAEPSLVVTKRDATNVPAQALYMLNSSFSFTQAEQAAKRLLADKSLDHAKRVNTAYMTTFSRPPTEAERAVADRYLLQPAPATSTADGNPITSEQLAWTTFVQAMMSSAEFRYIR